MVFYCDFHAHSRKFNVFMYGCENRRHSEKYLREQIYPLMLHKNTSEKFSFEDCKFIVQCCNIENHRSPVYIVDLQFSYSMPLMLLRSALVYKENN